MLKSCTYCRRIHDSKYICPQKQSAIQERQKRFKGNSQADKFRNSKAWRSKRVEIKERDQCLCQICIRKIYDTLNQYTYNNLSVHHAVPLNEDYEKRLDNDILITTCEFHHEKMESGEIPRDVVLRIIKEQENKP